MSREFRAKLNHKLVEFNSAVKTLLKSTAPQVVFDNLQIYKVLSDDDDQYELKASFQRMRQAPNSRKATENIFLVGLIDGLMQEKEALICSYATEISFCRMTDTSKPKTGLKAMSGFHFDFDCQATKLNHPIFHAQSKLTAGRRFFAMGDGYSMPEYPEEPVEIRAIRIPTPQMDIFSAVIMVLADHVIDPADPNGYFQQFLRKIEKWVVPFSFHKVSDNIAQSFHDKSPHEIKDWYPIPAKANAVAHEV